MVRGEGGSHKGHKGIKGGRARKVKEGGKMAGGRDEDGENKGKGFLPPPIPGWTGKGLSDIILALIR